MGWGVGGREAQRESNFNMLIRQTMPIGDQWKPRETAWSDKTNKPNGNSKLSSIPSKALFFSLPVVVVCLSACLSVSRSNSEKQWRGPAPKLRLCLRFCLHPILIPHTIHTGISSSLRSFDSRPTKALRWRASWMPKLTDPTPTTENFGLV